MKRDYDFLIVVLVILGMFVTCWPLALAILFFLFTFPKKGSK